MQLPAARPQGGGCRDGRPCDLFLRDFFCLRQKKPLRLQRKALWCGSIRKICPLVWVVTDFQVVIPVSNAFSASPTVRCSLRSRHYLANFHNVSGASEAKPTAAGQAALGCKEARLTNGCPPLVRRAAQLPPGAAWSLGKTKEMGWHQPSPARERAKACESAVRARSSSSMSCAPATARWCVQRPGAASTAMATRIRRSGAGSTSESST